MHRPHFPDFVGLLHEPHSQSGGVRPFLSTDYTFLYLQTVFSSQKRWKVSGKVGILSVESLIGIALMSEESPKTENNHEFRSRLKAEGRWDAYRADIAELQAKIDREEFPTRYKHGLYQLRRKYAPAPSGESHVSASVFEGKPESTFQEDILWVYHSLALDKLDLETCPSAGAYALAMDCRRSADARLDLYKTLLPKMAGGDNRNRSVTDDGDARELVSRFLAESE